MRSQSKSLLDSLILSPISYHPCSASSSPAYATIYTISSHRPEHASRQDVRSRDSIETGLEAGTLQPVYICVKWTARSVVPRMRGSCSPVLTRMLFLHPFSSGLKAANAALLSARGSTVRNPKPTTGEQLLQQYDGVWGRWATVDTSVLRASKFPLPLKFRRTGDKPEAWILVTVPRTSLSETLGNFVDGATVPELTGFPVICSAANHLFDVEWQLWIAVKPIILSPIVCDPHPTSNARAVMATLRAWFPEKGGYGVQLKVHVAVHFCVIPFSDCSFSKPHDADEFNIKYSGKGIHSRYRVQRWTWDKVGALAQ